VRQSPAFALAYLNRGLAWRDKGDYDRAVGDLSEALRLEPIFEFAYRERGYTHFASGNFAGAASDMLRALELEDRPGSMLYRFLAQARAGQNGSPELEANATRLQNRNWPYPLVEFHLGKRSAEDMLAAAALPQERCEAQFHAGQQHLLRSKRPEAEAAFKSAADACAKTSAEFVIAAAELKRLAP
jgi:lipoprotein NlpI